MTNKKRPQPPREDLDRLLRQLEQAPKFPEPTDHDLSYFSPWNVSAKSPKLKRTICSSLEEEK